MPVASFRNDCSVCVSHQCHHLSHTRVNKSLFPSWVKFIEGKSAISCRALTIPSPCINSTLKDRVRAWNTLRTFFFFAINNIYQDERSEVRCQLIWSLFFFSFNVLTDTLGSTEPLFVLFLWICVRMITACNKLIYSPGGFASLPSPQCSFVAEHLSFFPHKYKTMWQSK